jgi:hypothetical protein
VATVEIVVKTTDQGSKNVKKFQDNLMSLGKAALGATATMVAMGVAAKKAFDLAKEGAQIKQLGESFDRMNASVFKTPGLLDNMRTASRGTIKDVDLMRGLLTLTAGASDELAQAFAGASPKLLEIAKAANKLNPTLGDTAFLYNSLSLGIKRSSPLILDNLGIVVKVGDANKKMAESLGKSVEALTAEEKQFALLNETLRAGDRLISQVGGNVDSAADSYAQLAANAGNATDRLKENAATMLGPHVAAFVRGIELANLLGEAYEAGTISAEEYADVLEGRVVPSSQAAQEEAEAVLALAAERERLTQLAKDHAQVTDRNILAQAALNNELGDATDLINILVGEEEDLAAATEEITELTKDERRAMLDAAKAVDLLSDSAEGLTRNEIGMAGVIINANMAIIEQERAAAAAELKLEALSAEVDAFMGILGSGELPGFNETLDELGPKMVTWGGRTADQNRLLDEMQGEVADLNREIADIQAAPELFGLDADKATERIEEATDRINELSPAIERLTGIQGDAGLVIQEVTASQEELNRMLFDGFSEHIKLNPEIENGTGLLAEYGVQMGILNEQQAEALIRAELTRIAVQGLSAAMAEGSLTAGEAQEALMGVASGMFETWQEAVDANRELATTNGLLRDINGEWRADVDVLVTGLDRLREARDIIAGLGAVDLSQYDAAQQAAAMENSGGNPYTLPPEPAPMPGDASIPEFQHGGSFVVPPGFPNDTFPFRVSSGERVTVTPRGQVGGGLNLTVNIMAPVSGSPRAFGKAVAGEVSNALGNGMRG